MTQALPDEIVARTQKLGAELAAWARGHGDAPLAEQERGVLEIVREALPELLGGVVRLATTALQAPQAHLPQPCPTCGKRCQVHSWRRREVLTVCGPLCFERPWYVCPECAVGFSPADLTLGIRSRARLSAELRGWLVELGSETTFAKSASRLARLTGLRVSAETVRQHTERVGSELEAAEQEATQAVVRTGESAESLDVAPGQLVVETDGVMVRYLDGWHEVKLGLVAGQVDGQLVAPSYLAVRASVDEFGPRLLTEAARRGALEVVGWQGPVTGRGLATLRKVVVIGDGAPWIWGLAAEHFGERVEIVDYYHATEHVWALANAFYGEGAPKAKAWAERQCERLIRQGVEPLLRALRAVKNARPEAAEVLRRERGYFRNNEARMAYPTFRKQGLPIGSGAVESKARGLVQERMKRPGARWSDKGAQAVLNVRSHLLSNLPLAC